MLPKTGKLRSILTRWLRLDPTRLAAAKVARAESAEALFEQATTYLKRARTNLTLNQANALAQHFRKWAAIRNPGEFGHRVAVGVSTPAHKAPHRSIHDYSDEELGAIVAQARIPGKRPGP